MDEDTGAVYDSFGRHILTNMLTKYAICVIFTIKENILHIITAMKGASDGKHICSGDHGRP